MDGGKPHLDGGGEIGEPGASPWTTEDEALEALRFNWGGFYVIGFDRALGWFASRCGVPGHIITAQGPDGLNAAMAEDFGPVKA